MSLADKTAALGAAIGEKMSALKLPGMDARVTELEEASAVSDALLKSQGGEVSGDTEFTGKLTVSRLYFSNGASLWVE